MWEKCCVHDLYLRRQKTWTTHTARTFLGSQEAPQCFSQMFSINAPALHFSVVRKKNSVSAIPSPTLPLTNHHRQPSFSLFLPLFTVTAVWCKCVTSYAHHQSKPKQKGKKKNGRRMDSICVSSSCTLSHLFLLFKAEADPYEKEERGKLAVHLPRVAPYWIHHFIIRVWRGRSAHQLSFSLLLIEEMVTGSQWRAILLPAATGLAWLCSSQPADAPLHGNILPARALWSSAHTPIRAHTHTPQMQIIYLSMFTSMEKKLEKM